MYVIGNYHIIGDYHIIGNYHIIDDYYIIYLYIQSMFDYYIIMGLLDADNRRRTVLVLFALLMLIGCVALAVYSTPEPKYPEKEDITPFSRSASVVTAALLGYGIGFITMGDL